MTNATVGLTKLGQARWVCRLTLRPDTALIRPILLQPNLMPLANHFRHQTYQSARPTSPYHLLPSVAPADPRSAEFGEQLASAGADFGRANVAAIYCVHGTFVGNDLLGLCTELSRFAPRLANAFSHCGKRVVDLFTGEAGNYTRGFAATLEAGLSVGSEQAIPVRLFNWSSQNNHIARADGAVRLIDELAKVAEQENGNVTEPRRILIWGHSHGGNVLALLTQLLGVDCETRDSFFQAAQSYYQPWIRSNTDMPIWGRVRKILDDETHPLRQLKIDIVSYGTPVRYGWQAEGYAKLLHIIHHRPPQRGEEYQTPVPFSLWRARRALDGDFVQQVGICGTNFMPLPIAVRTLLADRRLDKLLEAEVADEGVFQRLRHGVRTHDAGTSLLVDYAKISPWLHRHIAGHGLYTRRRWLPFHCREIAERFYGDSRK